LAAQQLVVEAVEAEEEDDADDLPPHLLAAAAPAAPAAAMAAAAGLVAVGAVSFEERLTAAELQWYNNERVRELLLICCQTAPGAPFNFGRGRPGVHHAQAVSLYEKMTSDDVRAFAN